MLREKYEQHSGGKQLLPEKKRLFKQIVEVLISEKVDFTNFDLQFSKHIFIYNIET